MDSTNDEFSLIIRDTSNNLTQILFFSLDDCIDNHVNHEIKIQTFETSLKKRF